MKQFFRITFALVITMYLEIDEVHLVRVLKEHNNELKLSCHLDFDENRQPFAGCEMNKETGNTRDRKTDIKAVFVKGQGGYTLLIRLSNLDLAAFENKYKLQKRISSRVQSPPGYAHIVSVGFYKIYPAAEVTTYKKATEICEKDGAHLAVINSIREALGIMSLYRAYYKKYPNMKKYAVIGFNYSKEEGKYLSIFGKTLAATGYAVWDYGEPNNYLGVEQCGALGINGKLKDIDCDTDAPWPFICEFEPV